MRNRDRTVKIGYTWENETDDLECDLVLTATVSPGDPGDYDCPPSGPCVEFTAAKLIRTYSESGVHEVADAVRQAEIEAAFLAWIYEIPQIAILDRLEYRACEQAADDDAGAKEAAEEARAELRRERQEGYA